MGDRIHSFEGLGSGRYEYEGIVGEEDGGLTGAAVSGDVTDVPFKDASGTQDTQHVNQQRANRLDIMQMFRKGVNGGVLLTRLYIEHGTDWRERVFNISVNEALRTRGRDTETVIIKELGQRLRKKVWTPVDIGSLSYNEKRRIIRSSMFLKEKFLARNSLKNSKLDS